MRNLFLFLLTAIFVSSCEKFYSCERCGVIITNTTLPTDSNANAIFSLAGAPDSCSGGTVFGNYPAGITLGNADSVIIQVNVTKIGTYILTTDKVNNVLFTASGIFTNIGIQYLTLKGIGTPTTTGVFAFTPKIGNSKCSFSIQFVGMISFTNGGPIKIFMDSVKGQYIAATQFMGIGVTFTGATSQNIFEKIQFNITKYTGGLDIGNYFTLGGGDGSYTMLVAYTDSSGTIWKKESASPYPDITVSITSISLTNIQGQFSGGVTNNNRNSETLSLGKFNVPIN